ncbi:family 43 glycosylhydrolase [Flavobacterium sp. WC2509]|uniref:family 43 glycosylhydrolase n=1 Tax=Flavobacterium sp. WC2509 TaxID=3461406 RepID=UPI004043E8C3
MKVCKISILFAMAFTGSMVSAQNPVIRNMYTADPSARVFNDTLYVYPSHDRDNAKWWDMEDWHVFSTTDMKKFEDHGKAFSLTDIPWAKKFAWAPDCAYRNGKYYFYYPTDQDNIGVAVGNRPYGPFKDPLGKPLLSRKSEGVVANRDFIDPNVFIDDDGQAYLFAGQLEVNAVKLNKDMISYKGKVNIIKGTDHFFEAIWVHKYNGKYYMSYAGKKDDKSADSILYAMADNVLGPYTYKGEILPPVNSGTNHHSIVQYKGKWYLFYHTADLALQNIPAGSEDRKYIQWRRSVCVDELHYNSDGTIQMVQPTVGK